MKRLLIEDQERELMWLTPRDGFAQQSRGRLVLMFLEAIVGIAIVIVGIFALGLDAIH